jgi:hypothetical protein
LAVAKMSILGIALIVLGLALLCCGLIFLVLGRRGQSSPEKSIEAGPEEVDDHLQVARKEHGEP